MDDAIEQKLAEKVSRRADEARADHHPTRVGGEGLTALRETPRGP